MLLTKSLLSFFKMCFSVFFPARFKTGRRTCRQVGGAREEARRARRGEGDPLSVRTVPHRGAEMTDAPLREEGGREQKDGGNERKSKEENQEIKITYGTVLKKSGMKS